MFSQPIIPATHKAVCLTHLPHYLPCSLLWNIDAYCYEVSELKVQVAHCIPKPAYDLHSPVFSRTLGTSIYSHTYNAVHH